MLEILLILFENLYKVMW